VNNGTINAELAGGTIGFNTSALVNDGLARAQAGTMNIGVPLSGTGTLQVDATGTMNLANGAKTQGQLAMGAAGAALNLGTGNLTINTDYTNAGAGSGNSFQPPRRRYRARPDRGRRQRRAGDHRCRRDQRQHRQRHADHQQRARR
jgi:hypothetical protein